MFYASLWEIFNVKAQLHYDILDDFYVEDGTQKNQLESFF